MLTVPYPDWQAAFSSALLDADSEFPAGLDTWNGSDPARRFAVYRNNVIVNLVDGLCGTFPVCRELVGEEFFRAMATMFVRTSPPTGPVLAQYGEGFASFIARFEPAAGIPCLADAARLEWARVTAWHAADAQPLRPEDWASIAPEALAEKSTVPHPSAAVLRFSCPAASIWAAHQGNDEECASALELIDTGTGENCLVVRPHLDVDVILLPPGGADFIQHLADGAALGDAAAAAVASTPDFELSTNLTILIQSGFAIHINQ